MYEYLIGAICILLTVIILCFVTRGPQQAMEHMVGRIATKFLSNMLEQIREKIISGGYEHVKYDLYKEYNLPEFLTCNLRVKNLLFTGASKFVVNDVSYDITSSRAVFDVSIPKLYLGIGEANTTATVMAFGFQFDARILGWITIMESRIQGSVVLEMSEEKLVATGVDLNLQLDKIVSNTTVQLMNTDYSETVNNFLMAQLPNIINNYVENYKSAIEAGIISIANPILAQMF